MAGGKILRAVPKEQPWVLLVEAAALWPILQLSRLLLDAYQLEEGDRFKQGG